ncbi:LPXTG cell wall anchor domain-containing protein [Pseudactinotalea sp. HY158]|uniref:DUF7507 domain-containing protein n=1 Tax=Pseudactinotalea sp. HY158 TaxID=2654547 RepID=UPI00189226E0|nr:LPXTG cell wall anchor domain-containing protein [Pseudactinotalea sp. HY158]
MNAEPAYAADPLVCDGSTVYVQDDFGNVRAFDTTASTLGAAAVITGQKNNGLGVSAEGRYVYTADNVPAGTAKGLRVHDQVTGTTLIPDVTLTDGADARYLIRGGVNPQTGIYYYTDTPGVGGGPVFLGAYDPSTGASFQAGWITGMNGANGDLAFTSSGQLIIVADRNIYRVNGAMPTAAGTGNLSTTFLADLPEGTEGNGIAFGAQGNLFISTSSKIYEVNPATGVQVDSTDMPTGFSPTDMASCSSPSMLTLQKNIDGDRQNPGDQFELSASGQPYLPSDSTATTTGDSPGIQAETVGAFFAQPGDEFTLSEAAAGGADLAGYISTISCVDAATEGTVSTSGEAPSWTVTQPSALAGADVVCTITNEAHAPSIALTKTVSDGGALVVGDTVTYTFAAENTGNVLLTGVDISDPLPGLSTLTYSDWPGAPGELAPGETVTATATLIVTQEHVDAGSIDNTATVVGTPPSGPDVDDTDTASVPLDQQPAITLIKSGETTDGNGVGDVVTYSFTATNAGNVTLTDVAITDPLAGLSELSYDWSAATGEGVLAPGESVSATATYTLTQADVDAGSVVNVATAAGTPPPTFDPEDPGTPIPSDPVEDEDPATVPTTDPAPAITLVKDADLAGQGNVGDVVTYSFTATNAGNVTLTDVAITDPLAGLSELAYDWSAATGEGVLAPGESVTATATYTLTQADVDAGSVHNVASATGTPPGSDEPLPPVEDEVTVPTVDPAPAITLVKSGETTDGNGVGDVVTYSFTATNSGNVTLSDVAITDPLAGLSELSYDWSAATGEGVLAPGESVTATATYTLTQADVDAGSVVNVATAAGTPPPTLDPEDPGTPIPSDPVEDEDPATVPTTDPAPAITLVKDADLAGQGNVGDVVTYSFTATNAGNVTLTDVVITDPLAGLSELAYDWSAATGEGVLAPGESVTATATYTLTQADVDAGSVHNVASATGTPPGSDEPLPPVEDEVTVPTVDPAPAITLVKSGETTDGNGVGDVVTYSFTATNAGNVTLSDVAITDPLAGLSELSYDWSAATGEGVLAPGESVTATATYTLTQADVDAGSVVNVATAAGTPPPTFDPEDPETPIPSDPVEDEDPATVPTVDPAPAITLVKSGETTDGNGVGDVVTYSFTATNAGNVTLTDVAITDPLAGLSELTYDWSAATGEGVLAPGESVTATATYTLTQADVDAGSVVNVASAAGTPPPTFDPEDPGTPIPSDPVEDEDPATVPTTDPAPAITLVKDADLAGQGNVGDVVTYSFTATNSGNVTLTDVVITDPLAGLSELSYDWSAATGEGVLAPGESVTATATYTLTQADVDAGSVHNVASATGTPPGSDEPLPPVEDEVTVPTVDPAPAITLVKDADLAGQGNVGDVITYSFTATNAGNVTLSDVQISDPLAGLSELTYDWSAATGEGVLAPGESVTATATYTLTQADVDAGSVVNLATAAGTPPPTFDPEDPGTPIPSDPVEDEDPATVPTVDPAPAITLVKSGETTDGNGVGDVVTYSFTATNAGNVTLTDVAITDPLAGLSELTYDWSAATGEGVLAPGESVTATATYTLTQADVDAGSVVNLATAAGTPPPTFDPEDPGTPIPSDPVEDEDPATVPTVDPAPAITLVKSGETTDGNGVGDVVTYSFTATNSGNVTLSDVAISDPLAGLSELSYDWSAATGEGVLAPGESVTATATYTLTQADVDAGSVVNVATAAGTPPPTFDPEDPGTPIPSDPVEDEDPATVPTVDPAPAITLVKSGETTDGNGVGDVVTYSFTATNSGNVTLTDVAITDPLAGLSELTYDWSAATGEGVLAPGESVTATATYTLTQADVDAGSVVNVATAAGTPPPTFDPEDPGTPIPSDPVEDEDPATVPTTDPAPAITLVKDADLAGQGNVGDVVTYSFTASNAGNVTLTDVVITDPLAGLSELSYDWSAVTGEGVLAPGESVTATATYTLTQADVDAGSVVNVATAAGTPPPTFDPEDPGTPIPSDPVEDEDPATVPTTDPAPAITLVKDADLAGEGNVGDVVTYSFTATNAGNVTLSDVAITDPLAGLSELSYDWSAATGEGVLAPGESVTATATYTLTQADMDAGSVHNVASATGTPPTVDPENPPAPLPPVEDEVTVPTVDPASAITLVKDADLAGEGNVGDVVTYSFTATNSGNVTLSDVQISDPLAGLSELSYDWSAATGEGVLAPGESVTATATYTLTEADVLSGTVVNHATVTGTPPSGDVVDAADSATVTTGTLPSTGVNEGALQLGVSALALLILGAGIVTIRRRRVSA